MKYLIFLLKKIIKRKAPSLAAFLFRIKKLYNVLTMKQRKQLLFLFALQMASSIINLASVFSMVPFLTMAFAPDAISGNVWIVRFKEFTGINDNLYFTAMLGIISLSMLVIHYLIDYSYKIKSWKIIDDIKAGFFTKLAGHYLSAPYAFHLRKHSSLLLNNIMQKNFNVLNILVHGTIGFLSNIIFMSLAIIAMIVNNIVLFIGFAVLITALLFIYIKRKSRLISFYHSDNMRLQPSINKLILESFQSIEDITISGKAKYFNDLISDKFTTVNRNSRRVQKIQYWFQPLAEILAYGMITGIILIFIFYFDKNALPSIAIFGLLLHRMLPRFGSLFSAYANFKNGVINYDFIEEDLLLAFRSTLRPRDTRRIPFKNNLEIDGVTYKYHKSTTRAVDNLTMTIPVGSRIGIAGYSGSGKSTLVKMLAGLLQPTSGEIRLDGVVLNDKRIPGWQNMIGYVSQQIAMLEATVAENIALELEDDNIDREKVQQVLRITELTSVVGKLEYGMDTLVGERGVIFSGGERQRLVIARALYRDPKVIIFDEATSALDSITEDAIVTSLKKSLDRKHTMIMIAHRISTIADCDVIYCMENGRIVESGTYRQLIAGSERFKKLAKVASVAA